MCYVHEVHYYETDKMGITHHSNYIRWMEEARTDYLKRHDCGYGEFEAEGVVSPVISLACRYKQPTTFGDEVAICVSVKSYNGVKLTFAYEMTNAKSGSLVLTAESEHCFLDADGYPVIVKKRFPKLHAILKSLAQEI